MLQSFALIFLCGLASAVLFRKMKLPGLLGMLIAGILLGPYALNHLDDTILSISADLRQIALIIILMRAGLSLDLRDMRKVGRAALLLCFVPACFEIAGMMLLAPLFFGISTLDAAIMGTVVAAVSPAVVVPKMLGLMDEGYGVRQGIPQMIMAGASVDDVFVIVLFTALTGLSQGQAITAGSFLQVPVSILLGIAGGILCGIAASVLFKRMHVRDSAKILTLLGIAFLLVSLEQAAQGLVPFSGLLAVMSMGAALYRLRRPVAVRMSDRLGKLWVAAEIVLFVLVGATVDISYALLAGGKAVLLILFVLLFRMAGVYISLLGSKLTRREKLFCMIAYCPKATVQAAIGAIPLSLGLSSGALILTVAVLSILITAPLGAIGISVTYRRLLSQTEAP